MKKFMFMLCALLPLAAVDAQTAAIAANEKVEAQVADVAIKNPKATHIFVVGDSTLSPFKDPYYYPRYGYGTKLEDFLNTKKAEVVNLAISGRSSKSFLTEKNYQILKDNIKKGDYLIIGFGHNDEKTEDARYTNPNGTKEEAGSFKNSLYENYVRLAKDAGATPVLCTPIVRRSASNVYEGANIHITKDADKFPGGDYSKAIRDLGKETNTLVVDNTEFTKNLYEKLGPDGTVKLHAWLTQKEASVDNTHLNTYGASVIAYNVAQDIARQDKKFAKLVNKKAPAPTEAILVRNPDFVIEGYMAPTEADRTGTFATVKAPWWGTVFGDCGSADKISDKDLYDIQQTKNGFAMHSGNENTAAGKIASGGDGIAFCFQRLPANKDFTLTATAEIKFVKSNNQVAFGLMARDDVYIDRYNNAINSNYVAAGPIKIATGDAFNSTFARIDGSLVETKNGGVAVPAAGQKVKLSLTKRGSTYTAQYGADAAATYEVTLTEVDPDNIFVGMFTSRQTGVEFTDVTLSVQ